MKPDDSKFSTVPVGRLGIIVHPSCKELCDKIDQYIVNWRRERNHNHKGNVVFKDYEKDSFIIPSTCARFGTGEAKALISDSVRGTDLYIIADVLNYSLEYTVCGHKNHMSPDDIYADVKRLIAAASGKPKSITVILPFLYESRQHKRSSRESLDCAFALQELASMGVDNVLTFDAHDPRVQNAIPLKGFDNIMPTYQFIKALLRSTNDLEIDPDHMMIISPDEGAMQRAMYFANMLGVNIGMFYKRRDYSVVIDGRNPIVAHEYLGDSVEGKDVMIIDDMISSGESMLDVARELKRRNARRVFCISTFGMFTNGLASFDKAYEEGLIYKVITTNCTYQTPELLERPWYVSCDVAKYIALLIDSLNHEASISALLDPHDRIKNRLAEYELTHTIKEDNN
ncbi:MAG TPA: ribose-phosphate pyrophosphokinase [Candidatus Anaerobutyricum faecale]|uniref:ribose-phosphate pyrophosphokinase n=1 Tax=Eubacterium sp. An11 TaxID=1965542 RepID=UPI000B36557A|nr:ribose-phosphate pyrophosphokinase [Eubacterium sp. An11]OUQ68523.1 phosphoribosylpyrophosphate synthetase [Eubacterium sp. An11]HJC32697.1 ribose-phosphate pyrophosphokinase [Candidatus Anaerobutyricum faecale]